MCRRGNPHAERRNGRHMRWPAEYLDAWLTLYTGNRYL
jgi:hypothetical protein